MFTRIRNRLTLQYTIVMMLVLVAFIVTSSAGLLWILYQEEHDDLLTFAEEKVRVQEEIYKENNTFFQPLRKEDTGSENGSKIFYYVFDVEHKLAAIEAPAVNLRKDILETIQVWEESAGEVKMKKFRLAGGEKGAVLMCSMPIRCDGKQVGTIFVGEDISEYYYMMKFFFIIMLLVSLVFSVITAVVGYFMAGRAMVPIQQAFHRQREFVADASHEIRTPLSIFQASVEVVECDSEQVLSPFSKQVLADMKGEIRRMTKLVADLLTLARADSGVSNIIKEQIDLAVFAESLVRSMQPLARKKDITLVLKRESSPMIMADRERLGQLFLILLDNAIKYTPHGGEVELTLMQTTSPRAAVVRVRDTGEGISAEEQKLIFKRFYRVDKVRSREQGGVGLGLSIAKWIVDAHRGKIKVESKVGEGSTFIVTLPLI